MKMSEGFTPTIQEWIFASEGGYVDHPRDPGGATNMGITFAVLQAWYGRPITKTDVKNMPKSVAVEIYRKNYWDASQAGNMPLGVDYALFDYAVNSGVSRAVKDLQRCISGFYTGRVDGIVGSMTIQGVKDFCNANGVPKLILDLCTRRWNFMASLSIFPTFETGWKKRLWGRELGVQPQDTGVADRATRLSHEDVSGVPVPENTAGHAIPEQMSVMDSLKDPGVLAGAGGLVTAVIGAVADQPILQVALVAGVAYLVYRFVLTKRQIDPT